MINKLTSNEQVINKVRTSNEPHTTILGGWVVGGFQSVLTLRLSQPSLAGVGAGAELGNNLCAMK